MGTNLSYQSPAVTVVAKLGGPIDAARLLNRHPSNVRRWLKTGLIPAPVQQDIIALARGGGPAVTPADFFPPWPADAEAA